MTPELRGISRMTHVVSPLEQLGQITAAAAEARRLRRHPWLRAAKWVRGAFESDGRAPHSGAREVAAGSPTFLSAAMAVLLVTGAASALSPIGRDLATGAGLGKAGVRASSARSPGAIAAMPAVLVHESVQAKAADLEPATATYASATETVSPLEQLVSAYAAATGGKGSRLEPTLEPAAVALTNTELTNTEDAAPKSLAPLAEYVAEPAQVETLYTAVLSGLPAGSRVSKGLEIGRGEWVLALEDLGHVDIAVPANIKRAALAHVEIARQDGIRLARFPLVVDPEGHIDTETVAAVAVLKERGQLHSSKAVASLEPQPPQPVRAKPAVKAQKEPVAVMAPQQKRKIAAVRPTAPTIKPTTTASLPLDTSEPNVAAAPVGIMPEGSAGLETFRSFSLLGAGKPKP